MSRKQRTRNKPAAHEQSALDGQAAAQRGRSAPAQSNGASAANGSNGTNGGRGSAPKDRPRDDHAEPPAAAHGGRCDESPLEEPLQKGDLVVIRMRSDWELEGELRAINDEVVRIFDFAVCDVLRLRRKDIVRIERLVDAD
ncbi:MAG: hypothetical protein ACFCUQ_05580 [Kiloniellales bacterium]